MLYALCFNTQRYTILDVRPTTTAKTKKGTVHFMRAYSSFSFVQKQSSEGKAAGNLSETGDGGSSLSPDKRSHSNNSAATARTPSVDNVSSKDIGSNGTRMALQSSTLESTPEEDSDTSLSHDADGADRRARRRSTKAGGRQQQPPGIDGGGSATITSDSHDSDPLLAKGRDGGSGEGPLGGVYWPRGKQPSEVEGLPNRSTVDWEVAVVLSSSGADEMVSCTKKVRWEKCEQRGDVQKVVVGEVPFVFSADPHSRFTSCLD